MALRSERHDSVVDPDSGVYVEMEGIMEVRYTSEDVDFKERPEDFMEFQTRVREIPEYFCQKDKETTIQAYFYCLVCDCELKSLRPLRDHVRGNKHIRKACEMKKRILGLYNDPQNAPRMKTLKKERPLVDVGLSLTQRLRDCGEPAIGLEYVCEFNNPRNSSDPPMYTCRLDGCKSAWGTSDDMYNHVIKTKHHKNFFRKLNPEDTRIGGLSSAQILQKAAEYEEDQVGSDERDYEVIMIVENYEKYIELKNRPDDWSEKKDQLGLMGAACNSNMEPLGNRGEGAWGSKRNQRQEEPYMFDEEHWAGWEPSSKKLVYERFSHSFRNGVQDVQDMVDEFDGIKGDEKYEEIQHYKNIYSDLLSLFDDDFQEEERREERRIVINLKQGLELANNNLVEKVEGEDREMKAVSKLMAELEEEIENYISERDTKKYENIKSRLSHITTQMKLLQPTRQANVSLKDQYNNRLAQLWTQFETRSDSLVEVLEQQMERNLQPRKEAIDKFREEMILVVKTILQKFRDRFNDEEELCAFSNWVVAKRVLDEEVNKFTKTGTSWNNFTVTSSTKQHVEVYLRKKMPMYTKGEVYRRQ